MGRRYLLSLQALVLACQRRAVWVITAALALGALSAWYAATHFAITSDTSRILSRDLPFQRLQERLESAFPQLKDTAVVVIRGENADLADDAARRLAAWLRAVPDGIDSVYVPGGGEFFRRNALLYLDVPALWSLSDRLSQAQPLIASVAQDPTLPRLLSVLRLGLEHQDGQEPPPSGMGEILTQIGRAMATQRNGGFYAVPWDEILTGTGDAGQSRLRFVIVKPRAQFQTLAPAAAAIAVLRRGIGVLQLNAAHGVEARITGGAVLDNDQLGAVSHDTGLATLLSLSLVLILLIAGLRSPWQVLSTLITLFVGLSCTAAFALYAVGPLNLISVAFAVLFIGLGVDFGIQFCMRYQEESRDRRARAEALRHTALGIGGPLPVAAAAAALSFYSFVPTSYAGIVDLGVISGTSMLFALLASVTVLPALLALRPPPQRRTQAGRPLFRRLPFRHPRLTVALFLALVAAATPLILHTRFDFNPLHLQDPDSEAVRTLGDLLRQGKASPYQIESLEPNLASADRAARQVDHLPVVAGTVTLSSYVPDHQEEKLDIIRQLNLLMPPFTLTPAPAAAQRSDIAAALESFRSALERFARVHPGDVLAGPAQQLAGETAAYLDRFRDDTASLMALQSRVMDGLRNQFANLSLAMQAGPVTLQDLPQDLRERYLQPDGTARLEILPAQDLTDNANMRRFVDAVHAHLPEIAGAPVMLVEGGRTVVRAFIEASLISVALITLLLSLVLRDPLDVLMVLIPLAVAAALLVAAMTLLGIPFNLANIIVLPLMMGLGVAFGIYLVMRWRDGAEVDWLLNTSTPTAVLFSGLTTLSSFGSLAVADDPGLSGLGKTLSLGLASVLLAILLLLPALLRLRRPAHDGHSETPAS
jgi:hopanoid biosynthesis associated RND transporter like protein HpnN